MTDKDLLTRYLRERGITDEEILIMFKHGHDKRMAKTLGFALFRFGLAWGEFKSELSEFLARPVILFTIVILCSVVVPVVLVLMKAK